MTKPYSKSAKSKSYSGSRGSGLQSAIAQGANMETMRYQNEAALPNQHENDAQLFSNIGKSLSAPGDRPRGAWRNLAAGISEGLEHGAKSKAIDERKGKYDKHERFMDFFQESNNAVIEQNQWYEKRESTRKEMMPQVLAYIDNTDKLDPQSQRIMLQDMLSQYGEGIGEDFKLLSVDGSNPFLVTVQSSKGQQLFDLRSLFAGDEAMQQSIAMKMPEYQMKLQEERQNKQREFQLKERALEAKNPTSGSPDGNEYGSIPMKALGGKGMTPFMQTINSEVNLAKDVPIILHQISEAEKIINDNPSVGRAWNNYMFSGDTSKGLGMSGTSRAAYEKLDKITSRVAEAYIRAKGGQISDSERETIKQGLFKVTNSSEANQYNINSIRQELEIAKERGDFAAKELAKGFISTAGSFEEYRNSKGSKESMGAPQPQSGTRIPIFDPETKKKLGTISEDEVDQAVADGFLVGEAS